MKKPLPVRKGLLLYNIPIFGTSLYLIFFQNQWLIKSLNYFLLLLCLLAIFYLFITPKSTDCVTPQKISPINKYQGLISILSVLSLPFVIFILLDISSHYLIAIHQHYAPLKPLIKDTIQTSILITTFLTVILAKIINYFYYQTNETGWLSNTIKHIFKVSPTWETILELFLAMPIQATIIICLSIIILSITQLFSTLFHIQLASGINLPFMLVAYAYLMLPKLPGTKKLFSYLQNKTWETGHFYLLSLGIGAIIWLAINAVIHTLPPAISQYFYTDHLFHLSFISPRTAWMIFIITFSMMLSVLLATAIVRLQKNYCTNINIPIALFYGVCFLLLHKMPIHFQLGFWEHFILLLFFIGIIGISCFYMKGNQLNLIGFLPNKTNIKTRRPAKYLLPSIHSTFIVVALYAIGGIYTLTFITYLAIMPTLLIIIITMFCFPLLKFHHS